MSDQPAISVQSLGKRYVLSHTRRRDTLRDAIHDGVRGLWHKFAARAPASASEEFWALRDVAFDVRRGEVMGVIGRNGAGKSTLLKVLSRITEPTTGEVRIRGRVASLLEVGTGFHPELSGRENVFLNGAILGMTRAEIRRKFDAIVGFAEVERFLDTPVKHYSSGMYVRLAFAVAAHLEPEILIVDEVLAVGDVAFQKKCLGKMKEVTGEGRTVLFVSHNQAAIEALCDRALLLDAGRLITVGTTSSVYRQYSESFSNGGLSPRVTTPWLSWGRIANLDMLQRLKCSDDVILQLQVRTGARALERAEFDCALVNERGEMVTHARSRFLGRTFNVAANHDCEIVFSFRKPNLAPGAYSLIVYVKDETNVLLWLEGIPACRVIAASDDFPEVPLLDSVRSATVPPFTLQIT